MKQSSPQQRLRRQSPRVPHVVATKFRIRDREIRKILAPEMRRKVVHMLPRNCPSKTQSIRTTLQVMRQGCDGTYD